MICYLHSCGQACKSLPNWRLLLLLLYFYFSLISIPTEQFPNCCIWTAMRCCRGQTASKSVGGLIGLHLDALASAHGVVEVDETNNCVSLMLINDTQSRNYGADTVLHPWLKWFVSSLVHICTGLLFCNDASLSPPPKSSNSALDLSFSPSYRTFHKSAALFSIPRPVGLVGSAAIEEEQKIIWHAFWTFTFV